MHRAFCPQGFVVSGTTNDLACGPKRAGLKQRYTRLRPTECSAPNVVSGRCTCTHGRGAVVYRDSFPLHHLIAPYQVMNVGTCFLNWWVGGGFMPRFRITSRARSGKPDIRKKNFSENAGKHCSAPSIARVTLGRLGKDVFSEGDTQTRKIGIVASPFRVNA